MGPLSSPPSPELPCGATPAASRRADADAVFLELRRKVQECELLSASAARLLAAMRFNGRLTVVVHNGRVLKCGYEEGYFRRRHEVSAGI